MATARWLAVCASRRYPVARAVVPAPCPGPGAYPWCLGTCPSRRPGESIAYADHTLFATEASATPGNDAAPIAAISQATEVELPGEAALGYPDVYYDGRAVWVPALYFPLGVRPGIDTCVTAADTSLLDAPGADASVLDIILEGQAAIVTGASVDGYDAAVHDETGGLITKRDRLR